MKLYTISREITNPYENLALESYLMEIVEDNSCILYLWQNEPTVVIGRNQNVWSECRTSLLQQDGVHLARRYSGGGAVYHDLGNLNFTFVAKEGWYDQGKQFSVIQTACAKSGIDVVLSGRNDLLANGYKFSGNAFLHHSGAACHHGTILVGSDFSKLAGYLTPPKAKLQAKGVASVRSRVTNLQDLCPGLTVRTMQNLLLEAFQEVYQSAATPLPLPEDADLRLQEKARQLADPQWLYGSRMAVTCTMEDRFPWGCIRLDLQVEGTIIKAVDVYTDSLDWTLADTLRSTLTGCAFQKSAMVSAMSGKLEETVLADISSMLNI